MTVPTVINKNSSLDFSLTGTSAPTIVVGHFSKNAAHRNTQRDTESGLSAKSVDINANSVLPHLMLTKSTNGSLMNQNVEHSMIYKSSNVPSFYINMGTSRKGSPPKVSFGNSDRKKESSINPGDDSIPLTGQTQVVDLGNIGVGNFSEDQQNKTYPNVKDESTSDKTPSPLTEDSAECSDEENYDNKEKHRTNRRKHRKHKKTSSNKLSRLRHANPHRALPCPPKPTKLHPTEATITADHMTASINLATELTLCSLQSNENAEEHIYKLQVLPNVTSLKNQPEIRNSTVSNTRRDSFVSASMPGKVTKVFLSERQSGTLREHGFEFPCAPPATPIPDPLLRYEYIASMADIRAQRAVKVRLEALEKMEQKKREQIRSEKLRKEKQNLKDRERELKHQQRLEIYALNKVMSEFERKNFEKFCKANGINS